MPYWYKTKVRGSSFECPQGHRWGFANVSIAQARREGIDRCPTCHQQGKGKALKTPL